MSVSINYDDVLLSFLMVAETECVTGMQDMLMKMPGINSKNIYTVMNRVENLVQLVKLSLAELTEMLGSSANAKLLHDFFHSNDQFPKTDTAAVLAAQSSKVAFAAVSAGKTKSKPALRRKSPRMKKK